MIILLISCGGAGDTATESSDATSEEVVEEAAEEAMDDEAEEAMEEEEVFPELEEDEQGDFEAIGSEGSDDIPPTPESGPKVEGTRTSNGNEQGEISNPDVRAQTDDEFVELTDNAASDAPLGQASQLSAGEIDDNLDFDSYLAYLNGYPSDDILLADVSDRVRILVLDSQTQPVVGAKITISADDTVVTQLATHSDGSVFFFPNTYENTAVSYTLNISHNAVEQTEIISLDTSQTEWTFTLPDMTVDNTAVTLDLVFLIDTTASMRDELNELKENIQFIATQVNNLPTNLDIQYGMITYRDVGEEYVTNQTPFTDDINQFANALALVTAGGGGDYPEDLHSALAEGLNDLAWRDNDRIGLIFVVADAPPHLDYDQSDNYLTSIQKANEAGIKIFPIASTGLDEQGQYIFRQLAQMTNGRFIFITDDGSSGQTGDSGASVSIDSDYTVGQLDQLIINIISDEIENLIQN